MTTRTVLLTCHDAGGTVPPMLAIAEALHDAGHRVVILSQPSVRARAEAVGCTFAAFSDIPDYARDKPLEDQFDVLVRSLSGKRAGDDLVELVDRYRVDVVVVDANLGGVLAAAEHLAQPSAVLLHSMLKTFVDTWLGEFWPFLEPGVNAARAAYGLVAAHDWPEVFAGHERILSVVPAVFDAPVPLVPEALRHFGFLVPRDRSAGETADFPPGADPTVLVGLSTTYREHETQLAPILDALDGLAVRALVTTAGMVDADALPRLANVTITEFVPHTRLLPHADVMLTHAGLGSVAGALTFGVPLVCAPVDRDQPLNAQRVAELGAGIALGEHAKAADIAAALESVLSKPSYRAGATALADASKGEGGATALAAELLALVD